MVNLRGSELCNLANIQVKFDDDVKIPYPLQVEQPALPPGSADSGVRYHADPVCAFPGGRARSSVPGVRPSASIRYRV